MTIVETSTTKIQALYNTKPFSEIIPGFVDTFDTLTDAVLAIAEIATPKSVDVAQQSFVVNVNYPFTLDSAESGEDGNFSLMFKEIDVTSSIPRLPLSIHDEPNGPVTSNPNLQYRVFKDGVRLAGQFTDWNTDTFQTKEDANAFVFRWCYPGKTIEEVPFIEMTLDEPYTIELNDGTKQVFKIIPIDLTIEFIAEHERIKYQNVREQPENKIVINCAPDGRCTSVTRNVGNTILESIWEASPQVTVSDTWKTMVKTAALSKKKFVPIYMSAKDVLQVNSLLPSALSHEKLKSWQSALSAAQQSMIYMKNVGADFNAILEITEYLKSLSNKS